MGLCLSILETAEIVLIFIIIECNPMRGWARDHKDDKLKEGVAGPASWLMLLYI